MNQAMNTNTTNPNQLMQVFNYDSNEIRVVMIDGNPWWVAYDVCRVLEIQNPADAIKRLDEDERGIDSIYTLGGKQEMAVINEPGLYTLVLGSRKPEAKAFKRWITHEVIPSIRKTGGYNVNEFDMSNLSPYAQCIIHIEGRQNEQEAKLNQLNETVTDHEIRLESSETKLDCVNDTVMLRRALWREDTDAMIEKMAQIGGNLYSAEKVQDIAFRLLQKRLGVNLVTRVKNRYFKMARAGKSESELRNIGVMDIIGDDKKLREGYISIVKELMIAYGVAKAEVAQEMREEQAAPSLLNNTRESESLH